MTRTEAERERRRAELVERPNGYTRHGGGVIDLASGRVHGPAEHALAIVVVEHRAAVAGGNAQQRTVG